MTSLSISSSSAVPKLLRKFTLDPSKKNEPTLWIEDKIRVNENMRVSIVTKVNVHNVYGIVV